MSERRRVGQHELWREPETGFLYLVNEGMMNEEEAAGVLEAMRALTTDLAPNDPVFFIADNRKATGFTSGARKVLANGSGNRGESRIAIFGVAFVYGAALKLLLKTISVVARNAMTVNIVANEAEARTWLLEQQRIMRERRPSA